MKTLNELYYLFVDPDKQLCELLYQTYTSEYKIFSTALYKKYGNGGRAFSKKWFGREKLKELYQNEWNYFFNTIYEQYETCGVGLKLLAREIGITYTTMRKVMQYLNIPIRRGQNVVTDNLRKVRSINATNAGGWRDRRSKSKNTERGVQGYFFNRSKKKYVWLRSTYEVILAKWLDKNRLDWDVECQRWMVNDESYTPDFFIYENNKLVKIIEVKGYFKNRLWKFDKLKKEPSLQNVEFCLIDNITPFLDGNTYLGELKWWKQNRLLKLE